MDGQIPFGRLAYGKDMPGALRREFGQMQVQSLPETNLVLRPDRRNDVMHGDENRGGLPERSRPVGIPQQVRVHPAAPSGNGPLFPPYLDQIGGPRGQSHIVNGHIVSGAVGLIGTVLRYQHMKLAVSRLHRELLQQGRQVLSRSGFGTVPEPPVNQYVGHGMRLASRLSGVCSRCLAVARADCGPPATVPVPGNVRPGTGGGYIPG